MIENIVFTIFHYFQHLGFLGVFLSMVIENIGIPLPTEIGYLIGQDLASHNIYSYKMVILLLTAGHLLGSLISYGIGRWGDNVVSRKIEKTKKIVQIHEKLEKWYAKYGNFTVFLTRFIGYVRPWSSFVAGFARVKLWQFIIFTTLGSLIFNIINLYLSGIFFLIWRKYIIFHFYIVLAFGIAFFALVFYWLLKKIINRG